MSGTRIGFVAAALLLVAGAADAQRPRSDRDGVLDGRIPVIVDRQGRSNRIEDRRGDFARARAKCERHAARARWWNARGGRNAEQHALREFRKAERCFDRLAEKQRKQALKDARRTGRNRDDVFRRGRRDVDFGSSHPGAIGLEVARERVTGTPAEGVIGGLLGGFGGGGGLSIPSSGRGRGRR